MNVALFSIDGLVEIFWRGRQDWHATLHSSNDPGCTRWGTSIQLTSKGVQAVQRFQESGQLRSQITTAHDRLKVNVPVRSEDFRIDRQKST